MSLGDSGPTADADGWDVSNDICSCNENISKTYFSATKYANHEHVHQVVQDNPCLPWYGYTGFLVAAPNIACIGSYVSGRMEWGVVPYPSSATT